MRSAFSLIIVFIIVQVHIFIKNVLFVYGLIEIIKLIGVVFIKNSKRKIVYSLFALLIMLGVTLGVNATETRAIKNFNGTVNHNWGYVSIEVNPKC